MSLPTAPSGSSPVSPVSTPPLRLRIDLAYDGTAFHGWAQQPGLRTVAGELGRALAVVLREPEPVTVTTAGRTDAGVHASGAVAHVDVDPAGWAALPGRSSRSPQEAAVLRLRALLPDDVTVRAARPAPPGFDARFSALWRRYRYRICDEPGGLDPLRRWDTVLWRGRLDLDAMNEACAGLLGLGDFAAFCKRRDGATTVRTLLDYHWAREPDGTAVATVRADAFCHSMVRSLVGAVVPVGVGRRPVDWPARVQAGGLRDGGVTVMPAHGLTLVEVAYPPDEQLAARAQVARARRDQPTA